MLIVRQMNETQFYLSVAVMPGVTILVVLLGILLNNSRFNTIEARMTAWDARFDLLVGKVADIDNRLSRLEERLAR